MKYYKICQKILGQETFATLINELLNDIINKFGKEINIEEFVKILEINIDALIMLGISIKYPNKKDGILEELEMTTPYLVANSIKEFEEKMESYITTISKNLKD